MYVQTSSNSGALQFITFHPNIPPLIILLIKYTWIFFHCQYMLNVLWWPGVWQSSVLHFIVYVAVCVQTVTAEELWKGVLAESGAGARKGRGKRSKRKLKKDLNRGQMIGEGEKSPMSLLAGCLFFSLCLRCHFVYVVDFLWLQWSEQSEPNNKVGLFMLFLFLFMN